MTTHRVTLRCPACDYTSRARPGVWCPSGHGALVLAAVEPSHRRKPPTASDRPPVGAVGEEPGSLFDARGRE